MRRALAGMLLMGLALGQVTNLPKELGNRGEVSTQASLDSLLRTPGTLHLVVPEASNWAFYLASRHTTLSGGQSRIYINKVEARRLCSTLQDFSGNWSLVRVLASEKQLTPLGFILPPDRTTPKGVLMEGEGLYKEMALVQIPDPVAAWYSLIGPKEGRAYVTGSPSQANLMAEVYLKELTWVREAAPSYIGTRTEGTNFTGTLVVDLGRGPETVTLSGYRAGTIYNGSTLRVLDSSGQDIGYAVITSNYNRVVVGVDTSTYRTGGFCGNGYWSGSTFTADVGSGPETFRLANCFQWREGLFGALLRGGCDIYDSEGRLRSPPRTGGGRTYYGFFILYGANFCQFNSYNEWRIHPLKYEYRKTGDNIALYLKRWKQEAREVYKGRFAVLPRGRVLVEGNYYSIPELAAYLNPGPKLTYVKDSEYAAYLARSLGIEEGSLMGSYLGRVGGTPNPERPKELSVFCER